MNTRPKMTKAVCVKFHGDDLERYYQEVRRRGIGPLTSLIRRLLAEELSGAPPTKVYIQPDALDHLRATTGGAPLMKDTATKDTAEG